MESLIVRRSLAVRGTAISIAALFAGACGGGGGGGSPATSFSFSAAGGSFGEGAPPFAIDIVLHTSLAALDAPASVDVVDLGNGTATSGTDYAAFTPQTVTFPIGSVDGAVQSVALGAAADQLVEGADETIRLRLQSPVGAGIVAPVIFTADVDDADVATVQFAAPTESSPDESSASLVVTIELDLAAGVTLGVAASARVADAGTGSANAGVDYAAFPSQAISFPAGSSDGATVLVGVQVNDDASAELDETVELTLSSPTAGTELGGTSTCQLTITDDDGLGPAAFVATEGATGVENSLVYDELVDLGSQTLNAGPNAGTRVRVTNAGGAPMDLGAPRLTGANSDDFVVEVEAAPLPSRSSPPGSLGATHSAPDVASPLVAEMSADGPGVAVRLDGAGLSEIRALTRAKMHGFHVPAFGDATLELSRLPLPIAGGAVLRVDGVDVPGGIASVLGDLSVWSGSVVEIPGSRVFLALSSQGSRGYLDLPFPVQKRVHLVPESVGAGGSTPARCRLVTDAELRSAGFDDVPELCSGARIRPGGSVQLDLASPAELPTEELTAADCEIAIETDYQLYQRFGSVPATISYVTQMMAAVSDRYFTDVQTTISIAYLGVYSSAADPWTSQDSGGTTSALLNEFRGAWAPSNWPVPANLAHFVSGANLGGGIAYVNELCDQSFGFGVSANISGNINWGSWTGQPGNFTWDFVVVAHELGHNFGASHTHDYCPPIDRCYANCAGGTLCSQGTIMSYCHTCGGMDNIELEFGPLVSNVMRNAVNASCLGLSSLAGGDYVQYLVRFGPWGATGTRNATLQFSHDAPNATQPFRIQLRGTATP